eukprot:805070-Pelagomonas_calceolata.AAC.1
MRKSARFLALPKVTKGYRSKEAWGFGTTQRGSAVGMGAGFGEKREKGKCVCRGNKSTPHIK